jgi:hypothetical protein
MRVVSKRNTTPETRLQGTWFIILSTNVHHGTPFLPVEFRPQPQTLFISILILTMPSHLQLHLPNYLFPSIFPVSILCEILISFVYTTCPAYLIPLNLVTQTLNKEYDL